MINEGAQYALKVTAVDEQEPVEALSASGADEAFRDRVGLRRTDRCLDDLDALACEDGVDGAEPRLAQQLAHSCRRDLDPEPAQFADDALISPARVLARQPQH